MDTVKQASILGYALEIGIVDGKAVIAWADGLIAQSEEAADWMIDISMHDPNNKNGLTDLLGKYSSFSFGGNLTEYIALAGCLTTLKHSPIFELCSNLVIAKNWFENDSNDSFAHEAFDVLAEAENRLETELYSDAAIEFANGRLLFLVEKSQALHPEIVEFLREAVA